MAKGRHAARLHAVQAIYQIEQTSAAPDGVIDEFLAHRWTNDAGERPHADDAALFRRLVGGIAAERERLDGMIGEVLVEGWTVQRLSLVLLAILRAGIYELADCADVPPRVTINEYVELAREFLDGKEPALVNAVLDRLAHKLRPQEMAGGQSGRERRT